MGLISFRGMAIKSDPNQFKLFMTGQEWQSQVTHSTDGPIDSVWQEKTAQANSPYNPAYGERDPRQVHGAGLTDSVREHGYDHNPDNPPTIIIEDAPNRKSTRMVQSEGHHRVAAAAQVERETGNPVFIPTNYVDVTTSGRAAKGPQTHLPKLKQR